MRGLFFAERDHAAASWSSRWAALWHASGAGREFHDIFELGGRICSCSCAEGTIVDIATGEVLLSPGLSSDHGDR